MGWGLPDSPAHYLDLASANIGFALLLVGLVGDAIERRKNLK
jgi:hypothetical protein